MYMLFMKPGTHPKTVSVIRRMIEGSTGHQQSRDDWELLNCKMGFMWIKTPRRNRQ